MYTIDKKWVVEESICPGAPNVEIVMIHPSL